MASQTAKILLETIPHLRKLRKQQLDRGRAQGVQLAIDEMKRLACAARDEHKIEKNRRRDLRD